MICLLKTSSSFRAPIGTRPMPAAACVTWQIHEVDTRTLVGWVLDGERSPDRAGAAGVASCRAAGLFHAGRVVGDGALLLAERAGLVASWFPAPDAGATAEVHRASWYRFQRRSRRRRCHKPWLDLLRARSASDVPHHRLDEPVPDPLLDLLGMEYLSLWHAEFRGLVTIQARAAARRRGALSRHGPVSGCDGVRHGRTPSNKRLLQSSPGLRRPVFGRPLACSDRAVLGRLAAQLAFYRCRLIAGRRRFHVDDPDLGRQPYQSNPGGHLRAHGARLRPFPL